MTTASPNNQALPNTRSPRDIVIVTAITVALLAAFPLAAVTGLALQFGFVIAAALLGVALLALPVFSRVLGKGRARELNVHGVRLPEGLLLHERHSWAREAATGRYQVGADDLLQRALGTLENIELPDPGARVERGQVLATLRNGERSIEVKAPFTGTVSRVNPEVGADTSLVKGSPYHRGWLVEMKPEGGVRALDGLRDSSTARPWLVHQVDRLVSLSVVDGTAPAMADGGEVADDFASNLDDEAWARVRDELF